MEFVFGIHAVTSLLQRSPQKINKLVVLNEDTAPKIRQIIELATQHRIPTELMSRAQINRLLPEVNHQGVVAYHDPLPRLTENDIEACLQQTQRTPLVLLLDGVQDPHNLGACLRSADAAGVSLVIAPKDRSVGLTPAVRKVASGAAETVAFIQVTNLVRTMEDLKELGVWIYGAAAEATTAIFDVDLTGPVAWVLGAEGKGLRRLTRERCDGLVSIPMQGTVASLNVSVTTGICLFETLRQRHRAVVKKI